VPLVRLLVPLIAAVVLLVQPVATWAGAGVQRALACCCPDPHTCPCHDHDGQDAGNPTMRRCGTGSVELVAPLLLDVDLPPAAPRIAVRSAVVVAATVAIEPIDAPMPAPEPPPF